MDQDFHTCVVRKTDRVLGISNGSDLAVERSKYNALSGVDAYAFAQDAGSECVIRNVSLCYNSTNCGSNDLACVAADDRVCGSCYCGSRSCRCLLGSILFPEHAGQEECETAGDSKDDGVKQSVVDGQISGDTGNAISCCADAHECCYKSTNSTTDHAGDEGLEEAHVNTEDSGLCDTESCGHGGRNRDRLSLLILSLKTYCQAGAELREVSSRCDGHPCVESCLSQHTGLDNVVHVVKTHDNRPGIESTHKACADGVADQNLCECKDVCLSSSEDRADDPKCEESRYKYSGQRSYEQVDHLRNVLVQPFLNLTHEEYCDNDRNDVALVA